MSPIVSLLNEMRGRLGMFVGSTSLTKLAAFLRGYEHALHIRGGQGTDHFLEQFRDWVQLRFGDASNSWEDVILARAKDEQAAVGLFWRLLDEYFDTQNASSPPDLYTFIAGDALQKGESFDLQCNCGGRIRLDLPLRIENALCPQCGSKIRFAVVAGDPGYLLGRNPRTGEEFLIHAQGSSAPPPSALSESERQRIILEMKRAVKNGPTTQDPEARFGGLANGSESHLAVA
jgi:hypothetical protein